jgi:hypothetical protein
MLWNVDVHFAMERLATTIKSVNVSNIDQRQWNPKIMMVPSPPAIGRYR